MRMKSFLYAYLALLTLLFNGCTNASDSNETFPELEFNVNPQLLDTLTHEFDYFTFQLPLGLNSVPDSVLTVLTTQLSAVKEGRVPSYKPQQAFLNFQNPLNFIILSSIQPVTIELEEFTDFISEYDFRYREFFPQAQTTRFSVNDIRCWQGRNVMQDVVRFRLILDNNDSSEYKQIDIAFPNDPEKDWGRRIESMLGTIKQQTRGKEK